MGWSVLVAAMACARPPAAKPLAPTPPQVKAAPLKRAPLEFKIGYYPAIGVPTFVTLNRSEDERRLEVVRALGDGRAASWIVVFRGARVRRLDKLVSHLEQGMATAERCPRRHARDDVLWILSDPAHGIEYTLDYRVQGPAECSTLEHAFRALMRAAHLECGRSLCLRPEEVRSGQWTCADGPSGAECRADEERTTKLRLQ
jgi:hypothetical protein